MFKKKQTEFKPCGIKKRTLIEIIKTKKSNFDNIFLNKNENRKNFGFKVSLCEF